MDCFESGTLIVARNDNGLLLSNTTSWLYNIKEVTRAYCRLSQIPGSEWICLSAAQSEGYPVTIDSTEYIFWLIMAVVFLLYGIIVTVMFCVFYSRVRSQSHGTQEEKIPLIDNHSPKPNFYSDSVGGQE